MADPAGTLPSGVASVARSIPVAGLDLPLRIRRGLVSGAVTKDIFGRATVAVGTWEQAAEWTTIASAQTSGVPSLFPLPADGEVSIVSTSAADTLNGTGARTFDVIGPGPGGAPDYTPTNPAAPWVYASVPMAGTTPVVTTGTSFWGGMVEHGHVSSAGSSFRNVGTITVARVSDGKVLLVIPPFWGKSLPGRLTVPVGWTASVRSQVIAWDGDTQAHWRLVHHHNINPSAGVRHSEVGGSIQRENSGTEHDFQGGYPIESGSTFWWEAVRDAGGSVASPYMSVFSPVEFYRE